MQRTTLCLLLVFSSCTCLAGNDVWETLFREKLKEADTGNSHAQYDVGTMYQNGRGVAANREKAIEWYRKAAAQNDQKAISRLNLIQSNEERFKKTLQFAGQGDVESQYDLGNMYTEGIGIDADLEKAREWYGKAASQGYEKAQYKLGLIYFENSSTGKERSIAFNLFREAAAKGYPAAQFYVGKMYASGQGVKRDYDKALEWLGKAADGGFNEARREIIHVTELLEGIPAGKPAATVKTDEPDANLVATLPTQEEQATGYSFENLMLASWNRDEEPVAYLPSAITNCRVEEDKLICSSDDQYRNSDTGTIRYKTRAIISGITRDSSFEVIYRNLVIDTDQELARKTTASVEIVGSTETGSASMNYEVKTGWGKEHMLQCTFRDSSTLSCLKNNTHAFLLESPQALAAGK